MVVICFFRCLSIPVTLRSVIHKVSEELRKEPTPEPVPSPVEVEKYQWHPSMTPTPYTTPAYHHQLDMKMFPPPNNLQFSPVTSPPLKPGRTMMPPVPHTAATLSVDSDGDKPSSNPLLATLLDQDSPSPEPSPVNESPMLSKLLGEETSQLASSIPAPPPQKPKKPVKRRSRDNSLSLIGRSPKHRSISDSESSSISVDHIDSTGISFDSPEMNNQYMNSMPGPGGGMMHGHNTGILNRGNSNPGMTIDLTSPDIFHTESPMKKLENSLGRILPDDQHHHMTQQLHHQHQYQHPHMQNPAMRHPMNGPEDINHVMLSDMQKDTPADIDHRQFYPPTSVPKNEKVSTSLEGFLQGSREVPKTQDPDIYANSNIACGDHKELSGLLRQNSNNQSAQNQHSNDFGDVNNLCFNSSRRGSTSCSPVYSDIDTSVTSHDSNSSKSCDNSIVFNSSAITNNVMSMETASFPVQNSITVNNSSAVGLKPKEIKMEKTAANSSLRSLLGEGKRDKFENNLTIGNMHVKHEPRNNLKLTLKKRHSLIESSPLRLLDSSALSKSKSTETFEFNSDEDDALLPLDNNKKPSLTLQINKKTTNNKVKKKDSRHLSEMGKRKRDKYESKRDKKKRKVIESVSSESSEDAPPVYTATTVDTEVKCDLKLKFIKSGGKLSTESSPKTSSPASVKERDRSDSKKVTKVHSDRNDIRSKSSSSSQKSSSHKHNRSLSSSSITVSKSDSKLMTRTPTIKLKPIAMPASSVSVQPVKTPPINSHSSKTQTVTPTSTVIGRIAALSSPISSTKSGSMTPPPSGKVSTPTGMKTPPVGKSLTHSSKSMSSLSGKMSGSGVKNPVGRPLGSKSSNGPISNSSKMFSNERKSGSPSGSKNTLSSSKSTSSLVKSSTSNPKPSTTSASNVLSFLKTNASGIANLPPIPKRNSASGAPSKTSSTPLSNPAAVSTSSYSSNTGTTIKSSATTNSSSTVKSMSITNMSSNTPKPLMSINAPKPLVVNKNSPLPAPYGSKQQGVRPPNQYPGPKMTGNSLNIDTHSMNNKNIPGNITNRATMLVTSANESSSKYVSSGNNKLNPINVVNSISSAKCSVSSTSSTLNSMNVSSKSSTAMNSSPNNIHRKISAPPRIGPDSTSGPVIIPLTEASTSTPSSTSNTVNCALGVKGRPRKSSLSAVIDKLTKSNHPSGDGSKTVDKVDDSSEGDQETSLGSDSRHASETDLVPAGVKRSLSDNLTSKDNRVFENSDISICKTTVKNNILEHTRKISVVDAPGKMIINPKDPRGDSRNLFTSLMSNIPDYEKESEQNTSDERGPKVNSQKLPEKELVTNENSSPSPAKKSRTQSPKTISTKFNGESSKDGDSHKDIDKDVFKVPTPKMNNIEDLEDIENLVVRRKTRISTSKPVLSPASPVSSPEQNLIIDCQANSPRALPNKIHSPKCNADIMDNKRLKSRTLTPSPNMKNSPINSPIAIINKEHSNPTSVKSHSPACEIDDELMNDAILGFGS